MNSTCLIIIENYIHDNNGLLFFQYQNFTVQLVEYAGVFNKEREISSQMSRFTSFCLPHVMKFDIRTLINQTHILALNQTNNI
jgi:hypothetical protein